MPSHVARRRALNAASPFLHRVQEGLFRRFVATMGRSDSRPLISPHFVAFAWRYRRLIHCFVPTNSGPELGIILELVNRAPPAI